MDEVTLRHAIRVTGETILRLEETMRAVNEMPNPSVGLKELAAADARRLPGLQTELDELNDQLSKLLDKK